MKSRKPVIEDVYPASAGCMIYVMAKLPEKAKKEYKLKRKSDFTKVK